MESRPLACIVPWAALSVGADVAWWGGLRDRSGEYEPLPLSMFVIAIWIPGCCAAVALGIVLGRAHGSRREPTRRQRPQ